VDLAEVRRVAKLAFIDEFIMSLPKGYETMVGERGLKLSGGEKQRIAIARVLLKNPQILIFDEATSALDNISEKYIQQAINNFSENKTTIIIAHRLSTIQDANKILVLQDGKIVESGTHKELLARKSVYYNLNQKDNLQ
jgi:ATP-binding cassette subfamily B protein